jgi:hypothetical protein
MPLTLLETTHGTTARVPGPNRQLAKLTPLWRAQNDVLFV